MPSVTTRNGSPTFPISTPLTSPPTSRPKSTVRTIPTPNGTPHLFMKVAIAIPDSAITDPSERSKPPVSITKVRPIETIQRIEEPVSSASMLPPVRNLDWEIAK